MEHTQARTGAGGLVDLYGRPLDNLLHLALVAPASAGCLMELWDAERLTLPLPLEPEINHGVLWFTVTDLPRSLGAILRDTVAAISTSDAVMLANGYAPDQVWSLTYGRAVGGAIRNTGTVEVGFNTGGVADIPPTGDGIRPGCAPSLGVRVIAPGEVLIFGRDAL